MRRCTSSSNGGVFWISSRTIQAPFGRWPIMASNRWGSLKFQIQGGVEQVQAQGLRENLPKHGAFTDSRGVQTRKRSDWGTSGGGEYNQFALGSCFVTSILSFCIVFLHYKQHSARHRSERTNDLEAQTTPVCDCIREVQSLSGKFSPHPFQLFQVPLQIHLFEQRFGLVQVAPAALMPLNSLYSPRGSNIRFPLHGHFSRGQAAPQGVPLP